MTLVPVMSNARLHAFPKHPEGGRVAYVPLHEALRRSYATDAHTAMYSVPSVPRRLSSGAVQVGVRMVVLFFDIDGANHKATPAWWAIEKTKLARLLAEHRGGYVYRTRGGYRIVYLLPSPITLTSDDDRFAWRSLYQSWCRYLARRFSIIADRGCKDFTRLFRLPHATRDEGVTHEQHETIGDPAAIGPWHCELRHADIEEERRGVAVRDNNRTETYSGRGRLVVAFDKRGWLGSQIETGKYAAKCPWEAHHSSGASYDTSTVLYEADASRGSLGWWHCSHAHCEHRSLASVLALFSDEELGNPPKCGTSTRAGKVCASVELFSDGRCEFHSGTDEAKAKRTEARSA